MKNWLLGAAFCCLGPTAICAQTPAKLPASPYTFASPPAGMNSNVALPGPSGSVLFVSNQKSNQITVLNILGNGDLSFQGAYVTAPSLHATGMAINPDGTRLYVTTYGDTVNVHSVAPSGTLSQMQSAALGTVSSALNGIVYVALPGDDFVYVNNNETVNTITAFRVLADGTLSLANIYATGGAGLPTGLFAAPRLVAGSNGLLYAANEGSNNISVLRIESATGNLTAIGGSPFAVPAEHPTSGSLAINASATNLFVGTKTGSIVRYFINATSGGLSAPATGSTGMSDDVAGLVVHPGGSYVVGVLFFNKKLGIVNSSTMVKVTGSPFAAHVLEESSYAAGALFNSAGTLFYTGNANSVSTQASGYTITP